MATEYNVGNEEANNALRLAKQAALRGTPIDSILPVLDAALKRSGFTVEDPKALRELVTPTYNEAVENAKPAAKRLSIDSVGYKPLGKDNQYKPFDTSAYDEKQRVAAAENAQIDDGGLFHLNQPGEEQRPVGAKRVFNDTATNALSAAARTGLMAAGGAATVLPESVQDSLFAGAQSLKQAEEERAARSAPTTVPEKAASLAGNLVGGLTTGGIGGTSIGQDVIDAGGSVADAQKAVAINTAATEAALATGYAGKGIIGRFATQVPASVATGAASRAALNQVVPEGLQQDVLSPTAIASDIGSGAFGAIFPNGRTAKEPAIRTGDAAVDAGAAVSTKAINDTTATPEAIAEAKTIPSSLKKSLESAVQEQPSGTEVPGFLRKSLGVETLGDTTVPKEVPSVAPAKVEAPSVSEPTAETPVKSLDEKVAELDRTPLFADIKPDGSVVRYKAPDMLLKSLDQGSLTADSILQVAAKKANPEAKEWIDNLSQLADRIGGRNVSFERLDKNNVDHSAVLRRNREALQGGYSAFYDPKTNKSYLTDKGLSLETMVHEVTHGVASKMLYLGRTKSLPEAAQPLYDSMLHSFDKLVKPALLEKTRGLEQSSPEKNVKEYGLTNIDEFYSEIHSNKAFRDHLRDTSITPEWISRLPVSLRGIASGAKNLYDFAVRGLARLMAVTGLRKGEDFSKVPQSESAYYVMYKHMNDLRDSIDDTTAAALRQNSLRNTKQSSDLSFLGEQAEQRRPLLAGGQLDSTSSLESPGGILSNITAAGLRGHRFNREIGQAREIQQGAVAAAKVKADVLGNVYQSEIKRLGQESAPKIDSLVATAIDNSTTPEARKAFSDLRDISPKLAASVKDFVYGRREKSLEYARQLSNNPSASESELNLANVAVDKADTYTKRSYLVNQMRDYGKLKLQLAASALDKAPESRTAKEQEALTQVNDVKDLLKKEYLSTPDGKIADADVYIDQLVKGLAGVSKSESATRYVKNLRLGSDVASERERVPVQIRKFLGEAEHPIARMMETIVNQASVTSQLGALESIKKDGLGKFLTDKAGVEGYTTQLEGEKIGPLRGLYTTPEIAAAIDSFSQTADSLGSWFGALAADPSGRAGVTKVVGSLSNGLEKVVNVRKMASTVANPIGFMVRNFIGSPMQALSNGNINPATYVKGVGDVANLVGLSKRQSVSPQTLKYLNLGIAEGSQLSESYSPGAQRVLIKLMDNQGMLNPETRAETVNAAIKSAGIKASDALKISREILGGADLWTKLANFRDEESYWAEHDKNTGNSRSADQRAKWVADRINNTNITPSRASTVFRISDKLGASTFAPYYAETGRTLYNNVSYGVQDALAGIKSGDASLAMHGLKRIVGTGAAIGYGTAAVTAALKAGGLLAGLTVATLGDDDARKKYLDSQDFTAGGSPLVLTDKDGKEYTLDVGQMDPYDPVTRPMKSAIQALAHLSDGDKQKAEEEIKSAATNVLGLLKANSAIAYLGKAFRGDQSSLRSTDEKTYNAILQTGVNVFDLDKTTIDRMLNLGQIIAPRGLTELAKAQNSDAGPVAKGLMSTGVGISPLDASSDIEKYGGHTFLRDVMEAKKPYLDLLKSDINVKPERVEDRFVNAIQEAAQPYKKLQLAIEAAKAQGKSSEEIRKSLRLGDVDKKSISSLLQGKSIPLSLVMGNIESDIKNDVATSDDKEAAMQRGRTNRALLRALRAKYSAKNLEDIENAR